MDAVTAKKLRTGEIAIWDPDDKRLIIVSKGSTGTAIATELNGASFHAIREVLGDVIQLQ